MPGVVSVEWLSSLATPFGPWHPPPNRDECGIEDERAEDRGIGWRDHAADARGKTSADEPGCERESGIIIRATRRIVEGFLVTRRAPPVRRRRRSRSSGLGPFLVPVWVFAPISPSPLARPRGNPSALADKGHYQI
jgi:hypothetical protein